MPVPAGHFVNGHRLEPPFPEGLERAMFGMGCFWGAEKEFWQLPGVYSTAVGYAGRAHAEPDLPRGMQRDDRPQRGSARRVRSRRSSATRSCSRCSGRTTIRRKGCDRGTTSARSTAPASTTIGDAQQQAAEASRDAFQKAADARPATGRSRPRFFPRREFYYAEDYHQQYLAKNPDGYCGLGGTGVSCPVNPVDPVHPVDPVGRIAHDS